MTPRDPVLRAAGPADAAAIADLHTAVWRGAYRGLVPDAYLDAVSTDDRRRRWTARLVSGEREAVLATQRGGVVGAASWSGIEDNPAGLQLTSLYVLPGQRGSGLAEQLLFRAIGDRPAWLWVFEANWRARASYRLVGFVREGPRGRRGERGARDQARATVTRGARNPPGRPHRASPAPSAGRL